MTSLVLVANVMKMIGLVVVVNVAKMTGLVVVVKMAVWRRMLPASEESKRVVNAVIY